MVIVAALKKLNRFRLSQNTKSDTAFPNAGQHFHDKILLIRFTNKSIWHYHTSALNGMVPLSLHIWKNQSSVMGVSLISTDGHGFGPVKFSVKAALFPNAATCLSSIHYNALAKQLFSDFPQSPLIILSSHGCFSYPKNSDYYSIPFLFKSQTKRYKIFCRVD